MYKIFDTLSEYNQYTNNGTHLTAGILYLVKENKSLYFLTNNIDGETEKYEYLDEIPEGYIIPTGNIAITENGENIDVNDYATASVNVPIPEGYIIPTGNKEITQNGTNIDVNDYATATVAVPIPEGYIIPSGNKTITQNGTNIDVNNYATASVNVTPNLTTQNITQNGTYQPSGNYDGFSSVTVAVPQPTGNISITENGENIDIAQYATATVNVAGSGGNEDLIDLIEGDIVTLNIPNGTTKIVNELCKSNNKLTNIIIPDSVTNIGEDFCQFCSNLTSVIMSNSVTYIGNGVFTYCSKLPVENYIRYADTLAVETTDKTQTSYVFKEGTRYINARLFDSCINLTSITIPDSVTIIGYGAFQSCSGLTSVTIPNSVTSIGISAFSGCTSLTSINIDMKTIPNTFQGNKMITTLIFGSNVISIGNSAFYGCSGLTSVIIGSGVTIIDSGAFNECTGLTSITIPDGVTSIGNNAFDGCTGLTSVTIEAVTPPTLSSSNAFNSTNNCPILVPAESLDTYKTATNWSSLASRIQAIA